MNKDKRLEIRIPESELKASKDTAKALSMHHSEFVRDAIKEKVRSTVTRARIKEMVSSAVAKYRNKDLINDAVKEEYSIRKEIEKRLN